MNIVGLAHYILIALMSTMPCLMLNLIISPGGWIDGIHSALTLANYKCAATVTMVASQSTSSSSML